MDLVNILLGFDDKRISDKCNRLRDHLLETLNCSEIQKKSVCAVFSTFKHQFLTRWNKAQRKKDRLQQTNQEWLQKTISFPIREIQPTHRGRPEVSFHESSERSKRRKTETLRTSVPTEELAFAAGVSLWTKGKRDAASVVKEVLTTTPTRASKYKKAYRLFQQTADDKVASNKALSVFVEAKLTRHQYNLIRELAKDKFPSYKTLQKTKKECYPENILVTEDKAEVSLQALLNHTATRLMFLQEEVLSSLSKQDTQPQLLTLISKWGCDGSAGHSEYKQKFAKESQSDSYVFLTSLVPLQLLTENGKIIWQNPRPSSPRFCRPLRLQFIHETTEVTRAEVTYIEKQIENLLNTPYELNNGKFEIKHSLHFTMTDGKVCNAATETTSTLRCYLCKATSKDFNNLNLVYARAVDESNFKFGLSTLHVWIRFFECLLHVAYKLPIKKWQSRSEQDKTVVLETKKKIQAEFKNKMGLIVDKPKPGFGSSNDGNTARRFFKNSELSSTITGIDVQLINKFKVILQVMASGYKINIDKFRAHCRETAQLYVNLYPWYPMPTTVHKILTHGPEVIKSAILPIGQLSEEAQEARNKDIRKYREGHSRKFSREQTMCDIFNHLLVSSDPLITSSRKLVQKTSTLSKSVTDLLDEPDLTQEYTDAEEQTETESDDTSESEDSDEN